jgi:hypothetical protein
MNRYYAVLTVLFNGVEYQKETSGFYFDFAGTEYDYIDWANNVFTVGHGFIGSGVTERFAITSSLVGKATGSVGLKDEAIVCATHIGTFKRHGVEPLSVADQYKGCASHLSMIDNDVDKTHVHHLLSIGFRPVAK